MEFITSDFNYCLFFTFPPWPLSPCLIILCLPVSMFICSSASPPTVSIFFVRSFFSSHPAISVPFPLAYLHFLYHNIQSSHFFQSKCWNGFKLSNTELLHSWFNYGTICQCQDSFFIKPRNMKCNLWSVTLLSLLNSYFATTHTTGHSKFSDIIKKWFEIRLFFPHCGSGIDGK